MFAWWTMFLCLYNGFDYTTDIAEAAGGRYCPEVSDQGLATVLAVQSAVPPAYFNEDIEKTRVWMGGDLWTEFYVVTTKNRVDADPGAECGETGRYWVYCFDRWMDYASYQVNHPAECIHDCFVLAPYGWAPYGWYRP